MKITTVNVTGNVDTEVIIDEYALQTLQAKVGGYIELITFAFFGKMCEAYVNEDGCLMKLPYNHAASLIANRQIVGNMVIITEGTLS